MLDLALADYAIGAVGFIFSYAAPDRSLIANAGIFVGVLGLLSGTGFLLWGFVLKLHNRT